MALGLNMLHRRRWQCRSASGCPHSAMRSATAIKINKFIGHFDKFFVESVESKPHQMRQLTSSDPSQDDNVSALLTFNISCRALLQLCTVDVSLWVSVLLLLSLRTENQLVTVDNTIARGKLRSAHL